MSILPELQVTIIGSGKVASNLIHALKGKKLKINEIYGRTITWAEELCQSVPTVKATNSLDFTASSSSIFIVAVKDDAIKEIAEKIQLPPTSYLAHTSGTVSMHALASTCHNFGNFYPLQTFISDQPVDFSEIPLLIEGNNQETTDLLMQLGRSLSKHVIKASEQDRQRLHVAAVFASNFTNRMLAAAEDILADSTVEFNLLRPLVTQSLTNAFEIGPDQALTGPAVRNDKQTIQKHLELLSKNSELSDLYRRLTDQIISKFNK